MNSSIRTASHKKYWYSDDNIILSKQLSEYLLDSNRYSQYNSLKSIIVPHSRYRYGGPTAAKAFINLNPDNFYRAIILGPSHHTYFEGNYSLPGFPLPKLKKVASMPIFISNKQGLSISINLLKVT